jgi:NAD(P)-dependent dehydrogenase (short-subunit alcohol dehydrogenase family)
MAASVHGNGGPAARGAVLVTGASTGIGRATALHLETLGFDVFAGVRRKEDGERVAADSSGRCVPVLCDITDQAAIDAVAQRLTGDLGDAGLHGLVNNAGIAQPAPIEIIPIDDFRNQLEVNFVGQVAVTQAMPPLLRRGHGRIVNVSSIGGRVASPALGAYSASKFAIEALSDALRKELHPWGIQVSVIEPRAISTEIWRRGGEAADTTLDRVPAEKRALYTDLVTAVRKMARRMDEQGLQPQKVAERIGHALTARRPRTRYVVGTDARVQIALASVLPDRAFDAVTRRLLGA